MNQTIRVNNIPPTLNEVRRMHYQQISKDKKEWERIIGWIVKEQKIAPVTGPVIMTYEFFFRDNKKRDPDGYGFSAKYIQDGLVKAGILQDDSFKHVPELRIKLGGKSSQRHILVHLEAVG
ncbi:hypothetical protein PAECIP111893_02400 [Paenibacillus plantiphilus]|uniref:Uncharacterized protein n=1 Tax=Paenibacillus plantiphilus TaxID=2905650 RepID=A0ABN8GHW5_9BACL|nr:RusA family crossover junction endodeoxyribonuclease [Paenibacillus plantiphilus]CAH1205715.1 hypothetical protein PAECIP111893_02400 [Paenibacillus plantiphilus]